MRIFLVGCALVLGCTPTLKFGLNNLACDAQDQCLEGYSCAGNQCVRDGSLTPGETCKLNVQCEQGSSCINVDGIQVCRPTCTSDTECQGVCNSLPSDLACGDSCQVAMDIDDLLRGTCLTKPQVCVEECVLDADCDPTLRCLPNSAGVLRCTVAECAAPPDCGAGFLCDDEQCRCQNDSVCPASAPKCDSVTGECIECLADDDCLLIAGKLSGCYLGRCLGCDPQLPGTCPANAPECVSPPVGDGGPSICRCVVDSDCIGSAQGPRCLAEGICGCDDEGICLPPTGPNPGTTAACVTF